LPLDIGTPEQIQVTYTVDLPIGMGISRLPEKTQIHSEFGEIQIEYATSGNELRATQSLTYLESRIPAEKYLEFRNFETGNLRAEKQVLRVARVAP
jgi:Domain of Unknown Function with PDB structure (DUF3858)